jgi:hypothetical protein
MPQSATVTTLNPSEKRGDARRRVLLAGKLVDEAGAFSTDCTICQKSETGARIRMSAPIPPGDNIYLIELRSGMAHRVGIAWKGNGEFGLSLQEQIVLKPQRVQQASDVLRQLWFDAAI